ncbi:MAG: ABC transporter ATP-binding protein [Oscillospiraceae bacterium]|nr:ABC transporter ATP-binding protein [Oscillospiraceae bacterium]
MIKVNNISYKYKKRNTYSIKNISCEFVPGKLYCITGPSGGGKTTLLSMIAGLDNPCEGEILINGVSLKEIDKDYHRRNNISVVFQAYNLFPLLSAVENVEYPMIVNGQERHREKSERLLELVGIAKEQHNKYPKELSGGQQQRVAIARALASNAKIILADEPTGNLDKENAEIVMNILKDLCVHQKYCVIMVTHDTELTKYADIVIKIESGKLVG